jgi:subtilisin family serine protease
MADSMWRVAVIDSGIDPQGVACPRAVRRFVDTGSLVIEAEPVTDPTGHGTQIAAIIASGDRPIELIGAQVLNAGGRSTAATVGAAVEWAVSQRVHLIHLSLGLREDRPVLAAAIVAAVASGVLIVASTPARGAPCYPASYPGVLRATGDARCKLDEIAQLDTLQADFGACAEHASAGGRILRGASIGAASLSRFIISKLSPSLDAAAIRDSLAQLSSYRGPERRLA